MPDSITLMLTPLELAYLQRAVERDIEDWETVSLATDMGDYAAMEVANADRMMRLLRRVEQEQVYTH